MSGWQSRWVYRNLVDTLEDGSVDIGLVNNSAETTLPVTNLQAFQPSEVFRTTAAPHADFRIAVTLDETTPVDIPLAFDTAWIGYTNATSHRNLITNGNGFSVWTQTNAAPGGDATPPQLIPGFLGDTVKASGGLGKHNIEKTWTTWASVTNNAVVDDLVFSVYLAESVTDPVDKVRLAIINDGSGDEISVDVDLADGSLTAVSVTGTDFPTGDATATAFTPIATAATTYDAIGTGYRVELHADVATGGDLNDVRAEIRMLMAGSETFTEAGEVFHISAAQLEIGETATEAVGNGSDIGALMTVSASRSTNTDPTERWAYMTPRKLTDWKTDLGWVHGFARVWDTVTAAATVVFRIRDTGNTDSYFEAGRIVIGESFKPAVPVSKLERDFEAGRAVWTVTYDGFLTAAEAERSFLDMYRYCAKRSSGEIESAGGQRYSPENKPVLFIADDNAGTSEPERVIYGTLIGSRPIVNVSQTKYRATVRISELPK